MTSFGTPRVRLTKAEVVFEEMRRQLIDGERPYGQTFSTYELAKEFDVSRRPVMDAVMRLQTAGFVEIESQVGCRVVAPTRQNLCDHIETTVALHSYACRLAAARATGSDVAAMEAAYTRLDVAVRAGNTVDYDDLNIELHDTVVRASGNARLEGLIAQAWDLTRFFKYTRRQTDLDALQVEHRALLDAVIARDAVAAQTVIETHQSHALAWVGAHTQE